MLAISQASTLSEIRDVQELLREYTTWAIATIPASAQAPAFDDLEQELASLPGIYAPPAGRLLLARHESQPAGCVALKRHNATTGELKRLYVRPAFRGMEIGRHLVEALVAEARQSSYRRVILDTHRSMVNALALYAAAGFHIVNAPSDFPEALKSEVVFMALEL